MNRSLLALLLSGVSTIALAAPGDTPLSPPIPVGGLAGGTASSGSPGGVTNNTATGNVIVGGATTAAIKDATTYGTNGGISLSGGTVPGYNACFWNDTDTCTTENIRLRERVFVGNGVLVIDNQAAAEAGTFLSSSTVGANWIPRDAQFLSMTDRGTIAVAGVAQSLNTPALHSAIGVAGYGMNNAAGVGNAWGGYFEGQFNPGTVAGSFAYGIEVDCKNASATANVADPYSTPGGCYGVWLAGGGGSGYGPASISPVAALVITNNANTWKEGIVIESAGLASDANSNQIALSLGSGAGIVWYTATGTPAGLITSNALNTIIFGGMDKATASAQHLSAPSIVTGTLNVAGSDLNFDAGKGTGTGSSGNVFFNVTNGGGSGSTQNALSTVLAINAGAKTVIVGSASTGAVNNGVVSSRFEVRTNAGTTAGGISIQQFNASAVTPANIYLATSRNGTIGSHTAMVTADQVGAIFAEGSDGTNFQESSQIKFEVLGTVSAGVVPGLIRFRTADTSGVMTNAMWIDNGQLLNFASSSIAANGVVATTVTSLGPTGSHTTIQEWLLVKNTAGTSRWIPMY